MHKVRLPRKLAGYNTEVARVLSSFDVKRPNLVGRVS